MEKKIMREQKLTRHDLGREKFISEVCFVIIVEVHVFSNLMLLSICLFCSHSYDVLSSILVKVGLGVEKQVWGHNITTIASIRSLS